MPRREHHRLSLLRHRQCGEDRVARTIYTVEGDRAGGYCDRNNEDRAAGESASHTILLRDSMNLIHW